MRKTKLWAVGVIFSITIIMTIAQILYKLGMDGFPEISSLIMLAIGLVLYGLSAILMIIAFKGGELTILYPIIALSFVWVSIFAPIFIQGDSMNIIKWVGVVFIILGISAIGVGSE